MLLTTKLFVPRSQPQLIARPRLRAALTAGLQGKVIIVTAPPGFGKTTLVADWLTHFGFEILDFESSDATTNPKSGVPSGPQNPKSAWLSLDEQDNDPVRFLGYLVAALQKIAPAVGHNIAHLLGGAQPPALSDAITLLLNDLAVLDDALLLVLDDYHLIQNRLIHEAMTFLVEHLPPSLRLLIASRTDPPFPLARWRVRRELCELREQELRFNADETQAFLRQTLGLELTTSEIRTLEQRTEGWIAGLQLATLSMNGRPDCHQFVHSLTGNHAYIVDYLTEEVLQRQPPSVQEFLLRTSILNRLSAPLCDWLMGTSGDSETVQPLLELLERNRLFLSPLDDERRWYRYHHLFADLLRSRLRQTAPDLARQLHRRASDWFAGHMLWNEAIHHAIQAHEHLRAAELIETQAEPLAKQGEHHTLASWIEQLPAAIVAARPRLGIAFAFHQLLNHQLDRADLALQDVAAALDQGQDQLLGEYLTLKASVAARRNLFDQAESVAHQAIALLPAENQTLQARLMVILGIAAYYRDDHEQALAAFAKAGRLALAAGDLYTALNALSNEGLMLSLRGELRRAAAAFRHTLQTASEHGADRLSNIAVVHGYLADVLHELNDLAGMSHHLHLAQVSCTYCDIPSFTLNQQLYWGKLHHAEGNRSAAVDAVRRAAAIADAHQMPSSNRGEIVASQVRLWLAYGNLDDAIAWAKSSGLSPDAELQTVREPVYIALARVLIAQGEASQALLLLARLQKAAAAAGRRWVQIELLALQAVAHAHRGARTNAQETLVQALRLGVSEGYIRSFVMVGDDLRTLLLEAQMQVSQPSLRAYIDMILAAFPPAHQLSEESAGGPHRALHDEDFAPLSERELEVLRLVASGYSDRQIADALVVVVGTAKRHLNNIYGKLLVHSRTQALARARQLGLLE